MGRKLGGLLLLGVAVLALGGCSTDEGPDAKHVSGKEINGERERAMSPEDREKMNKLSSGAAIGGKGR